MDWNISKASEVAAAKPRFSSVPTGSNIVTSPGQIVRHDSTHSSFLPAFHNSACLAACAKRALRLGNLLIDPLSFSAQSAYDTRLAGQAERPSRLTPGRRRLPHVRRAPFVTVTDGVVIGVLA